MRDTIVLNDYCLVDETENPVQSACDSIPTAHIDRRIEPRNLAIPRNLLRNRPRLGTLLRFARSIRSRSVCNYEESPGLSLPNGGKHLRSRIRPIENEKGNWRFRRTGTWHHNASNTPQRHLDRLAANVSLPHCRRRRIAQPTRMQRVHPTLPGFLAEQPLPSISRCATH